MPEKYVTITSGVIKQGWRCPIGKPFAVVNQNTGKLVGCHPTLDEAHQQMKALYAAQQQGA